MQDRKASPAFGAAAAQPAPMRDPRAADRSLYRGYVCPFVLFLMFSGGLALAGAAFAWDHPEAPWQQRMPELWAYPLQTLVCGAWLWHVRREIRWDWDGKACLLGVLCGIVGIGLWLAPYLAGWEPNEGGFEPERVLGEGTAATYAAYGMRFARAAIVVPFVEELFWRGYLMRWCIDRDFPQNVPIGRHSWLAYGVTTLLFVLIHRPADYAGAFLYGTLAYVLVACTKRLTPAIAMHAAANLIMGICAIGLDLPQLW